MTSSASCHSDTWVMEDNHVINYSIIKPFSVRHIQGHSWPLFWAKGHRGENFTYDIPCSWNILMLGMLRKLSKLLIQMMRVEDNHIFRQIQNPTLSPRRHMPGLRGIHTTWEMTYGISLFEIWWEQKERAYFNLGNLLSAQQVHPLLLFQLYFRKNNEEVNVSNIWIHLWIPSCIYKTISTSLQC